MAVNKTRPKPKGDADKVAEFLRSIQVRVKSGKRPILSGTVALAACYNAGIRLRGETPGQAADRIKACRRKLVFRSEDSEVKGGVKRNATGEAGEFGRVTKDVLTTPKALMDFECVLTSSRQDRDLDILDPEGADLDKSMPLLWQHLPEDPVGKFVRSVGLDENGMLRVQCAIADIKKGHDVATLVEFGALRISHGFTPLEYEPLDPDDDSEDAGWHVIKYHVMETSLVSVPSNVDAGITAWSRQKLHDPVVKQFYKGEFDLRKKSVTSGWDEDDEDDEIPTSKKVEPAVSKGTLETATPGVNVTINLGDVLKKTKGKKDDDEDDEDEDEDDEEETGSDEEVEVDPEEVEKEDAVGATAEQTEESAKGLKDLAKTLGKLTRMGKMPGEAKNRLGVVAGLLEDISEKMESYVSSLSKANSAKDIAGVFGEGAQTMEDLEGKLRAAVDEMGRICGLKELPEQAPGMMDEVKNALSGLADAVGLMRSGGTDTDPNPIDGSAARGEEKDGTSKGFVVYRFDDGQLDVFPDTDSVDANPIGFFDTYEEALQVVEEMESGGSYRSAPGKDGVVIDVKYQGPQISEDYGGLFWVVMEEDGREEGPFVSRQAAQEFIDEHFASTGPQQAPEADPYPDYPVAEQNVSCPNCRTPMTVTDGNTVDRCRMCGQNYWDSDWGQAYGRASTNSGEEKDTTKAFCRVQDNGDGTYTVVNNDTGDQIGDVHQSFDQASLHCDTLNDQADSGESWDLDKEGETETQEGEEVGAPHLADDPQTGRITVYSQYGDVVGTFDASESEIATKLLERLIREWDPNEGEGGADKEEQTETPEEGKARADLSIEERDGMYWVYDRAEDAYAGPWESRDQAQDYIDQEGDDDWRLSHDADENGKSLGPYGQASGDTADLPDREDGSEKSGGPYSVVSNPDGSYSLIDGSGEVVETYKTEQEANQAMEQYESQEGGDFKDQDDGVPPFVATGPDDAGEFWVEDSEGTTIAGPFLSSADAESYIGWTSGGGGRQSEQPAMAGGDFYGASHKPQTGRQTAPGKSHKLRYRSCGLCPAPGCWVATAPGDKHPPCRRCGSVQLLTNTDKRAHGTIAYKADGSASKISVECTGCGTDFWGTTTGAGEVQNTVCPNCGRDNKDAVLMLLKESEEEDEEEDDDGEEVDVEEKEFLSVGRGRRNFDHAGGGLATIAGKKTGRVKSAPGQPSGPGPYTVDERETFVTLWGVYSPNGDLYEGDYEDEASAIAAAEEATEQRGPSLMRESLWRVFDSNHEEQDGFSTEYDANRYAEEMNEDEDSDGGCYVEEVDWWYVTGPDGGNLDGEGSGYDDENEAKERYQQALRQDDIAYYATDYDEDSDEILYVVVNANGGEEFSTDDEQEAYGWVERFGGE